MRPYEDLGRRPERSSGSQAIAGAVVAILGVFAAANPTNLVLRARTERRGTAAGHCDTDGCECMRAPSSPRCRHRRV